MLPLRYRRSNKIFALTAGVVFLGLLVCLVQFFTSTTDPLPSTHGLETPQPAKEDDNQRTPPIPSEYGSPCGSAGQISPIDACLDAASAGYLRDLRGNAVEFCSSRSGDSITIFHQHFNEHDHEPGHDSFVIAQGVILDKVVKRFTFECANRLPENEPPMGIFNLTVQRYHWGLEFVFDNYIHIHFKQQDIPQVEVEEHEAKQSNYAILVMRERAASFWGSLMEIMSMTLSVDVLRMSSDTGLADSFIEVSADLPRTHVIILDDLPDGPLFDLWSLFSGSAPTRFHSNPEYKTGPDALLSERTVIIPLPGHSNPLALIDQQDVSSRDYSALARVFARRVLQNHGIFYPQDGSHVSSVVRITLITWPSTRDLENTDHFLRALRGAFPHALVNTVDLAAMPMAGQLEIVRSTDVLVGVHGDGLSHIMFMREGEGAVLEIQPAGLSTPPNQARYKKLAAVLGQKYFNVEAKVIPSDRAGWTGLSLSADELVAQVGRAIDALGASREV